MYSEQLVSSSNAWNGSEYESYPDGKPCMTTVKITIPPHTSLPWHTHQMPSSAYIISGTLYVEDITGNKRVIHVGEAFNESVNNIHRGYTESEKVEVIVTSARVVGQSLSDVSKLNKD